MLTRGSLYIHSCPAALKHHVEWSLQSILGKGISLSWRTQPLQAGTYRAEISWREKKSKASEIATALRSWHYLRFEVREYSNISGEGVLYRCTPDLGLHQAVTASTGDVMVHENRLITALENTRSYEALRDSLSNALGIAWDLELECYRLGVGSEGEIRAVNI